MALTFFTVTGNYQSVAGQEVWDANTSTPIARPMTGTVTFTPLFSKGDAAKTDTAVTVLQPVMAVIKNGVLQRNGTTGCKLVANSGLGLEQLFYEVTFFDLRALDGQGISLKKFSFSAPTAAATVDLKTVTPAAGLPASGIPVLGPSGIPSSATASGVPGQVAWNSSHFYVCTSVNTWRRVSLTTW